MLVKRQKILLICCGAAEKYADRYPVDLCRPLKEDGRALLQTYIDAGMYPPVEAVYTGKCVCCVQTATQIYPQHKVMLTDAVRPFDYGCFGGKSLDELSGNPEFQAWMQGGAVTCPSGGDPMLYRFQSQKAFMDIAEEMYGRGQEYAAIVAHPEFIRLVLARCGFACKMTWSGRVEKGDAFLVQYESFSKTMMLLKEIRKAPTEM